MPQISKQNGGSKPTTKPVGKPSKVPPALRSKLGGPAWPDEDWLKACLFGLSGSGKTTLWSTFPGKILTGVCSGGLLPGELISIDPKLRSKIDPRNLNYIEQIKPFLELAGSGDYSTCVLDHASGFQDLTIRTILDLEEVPPQKSWGLMTQQQWGESSQMCKTFFRDLLSLNMHVVIIAQERVFDNDEVEANIEGLGPTVGPALSPSAAGWLGPACNYLLETFKRPKMKRVATKVGGKEVETFVRDKGVEFCLRIGPHDVIQTKFRVPKGRLKQDIIVNPSYEKIKEAIETGEAK